MTQGKREDRPPKATIEGSSVVFVGSFDPSEFTPGWFTSNELVDPHAAEDLQLEVILPDVSQYRLSWLGVAVERSKLHLHTNDEKRFRPLRDLAHEVLRLKPEIELRALGINGHAHFSVQSEDTWHAIGHSLAPKETWDGVLRDAGLLTMTIQGMRDDDREGFINTKVEPSRQVRPGIFVDVNDHFQLATGTEFADAVEAMRILELAFEDVVARRQSLFARVMAVASGERQK